MLSQLSGPGDRIGFCGTFVNEEVAYALNGKYPKIKQPVMRRTEVTFLMLISLNKFNYLSVMILTK